VDVGGTAVGSGVFVGDAVGVDDGVALGVFVADGDSEVVAVGGGAASRSPVFMRKAIVAAAPATITAARTVYVRMCSPCLSIYLAGTVSSVTS
jgi:hypothetical protein